MIDRLDELNRVLFAVSDLAAEPTAAVDRVAILELCASTVQAGLLPDHELTLEFAEQKLKFLASEDAGVRITEDGVAFLLLNPDKFYTLTESQRHVLARKHYLGSSFEEECKSLLKAFTLAPDTGRLTWSELDDAALTVPAWVASHLVQLGVLTVTDQGYETPESMAAVVLDFKEQPKGLTEAKMEAMLLEKRQIGDVGEKIALRYERDRLATAGAEVHAHCVRRIGNIRLNAGYDIESFDGAAESMMYDRFIEVKASKGRDLRFIWTENEMKVAANLGAKYWIYFFGGINPAEETSSHKPLLFQDPIRSVLENSEFAKVSQGYIVESKMRGDKW